MTRGLYPQQAASPKVKVASFSLRLEVLVTLRNQQGDVDAVGRRFCEAINGLSGTPMLPFDVVATLVTASEEIT